MPNVIKYKVSDLVVYPGYGVARVIRIDTKTVNGKSKDFYVLKQEHGLIVFISSIDSTNIELRPLTPKAELEHLLKDINKPVAINPELTWNRRYREHMEHVKTGSLVCLVQVYRSLLSLRLAKDLSFGERKMLYEAKRLLIEEIAAVMDMSLDDVEGEYFR